MNKFTKISLAIAVLCSATAATAQTTTSYNPSWYMAPSLNIIDPDDAFRVNDNGEGASIKFGKPVSPSWDMQFGYTYARSRANGLRYQQQSLGLDGLFMFSRKSIRPYLVVGVGAQRDKLDTPIREIEDTSPYLSAGLGVQMDLNDRWTLQADVRRQHGFMNDNNFRTDRTDNNYFNIGFNYVFDKPVVRAPARVVVAQAPAPAPVVVMTPPPPPPRPAPAPAPAPQPRFERVTMSATELFEFDKAQLRSPQPKLDEIAQALKSSPPAGNVNVVGHADRLGSDKYNLELSGRRAEAVRGYLMNQGVEGSRLRTVAKGESEPVVQCTEKNRAALIRCLEPNRRVVIEEIVIERRVN